MISLPQQVISDGFAAVGLRPGAVPMGHVLNVDHFHMSWPTFPPHPHAGFAAVTAMLPWSEGAFINRDSRGDRSRIGPGAVHWTLAGSGMLHEEIPERPGTDCEGLQIFVKLPEAHERTEPRAFHLDAEHVPTSEHPGGLVRVLVGEHEGLVSPIVALTEVTMLHVSVRGALELRVPAGVEAFAMGLRGRGRLDDGSLAAHTATSVAAGERSLRGDDLELLVGWSPAMPSLPTFQGPFCMFRPEHLREARQRFGAGRMGTLSPSPVQWRRA